MPSSAEVASPDMCESEETLDDLGLRASAVAVARASVEGCNSSSRCSVLLIKAATDLLNSDLSTAHSVG